PGPRVGRERAHEHALLGPRVSGPLSHGRRRRQPAGRSQCRRGLPEHPADPADRADRGPGVGADHADLRPLPVDRPRRPRRAVHAARRLVLVVAVIFLFLGRATDTIIPAVALPLSLLLTFVVMRFLGYSLDNLSLMALTLAIGFLIDDAIVFLENTVRRM